MSDYAEFIFDLIGDDLISGNRKRRRPSVESLILARLRAGPVDSLFELAMIDLGITYAWAWEIVRRLEARGAVDVERRGPGRAMSIRLHDGDQQHG